ncbi:hypothetical protein Taqua_01518 [Tepidimonas aquatica]|jgi:hypothetical protein|uniref:Uncharacterized protein n=2 Tax=Tepidimonas TaxID=114248 RepID=A0A4R3LAB8_9BURK|nr:hypothetical protein [Tepidimonas ignava]TCS96100.1 hypothetical protein EDC36_11357 [Tepidimonas ignava]TSE21120.1 hypothetical protein Tigna_01757 [Tepidimonas ignava]TSE24584.1 hypothetical protein Taqua_01518 [Tepidimonas aquatica]
MQAASQPAVTPTPDDVFVWDTTLLTGIDSVDQQHHHLVDLFNALNRAMFHGQALSPQPSRLRLIRLGMHPVQAYQQEEDPRDRRVANLLRMVGQLYHVLAVQNQDLLEANARLEQRVRPGAARPSRWRGVGASRRHRLVRSQAARGQPGGCLPARASAQQRTGLSDLQAAGVVGAFYNGRLRWALNR